MRKRVAALAGGLLLLLAIAGAGSAWTSEIATFTYDSRGRLTQTSHSGGPNNGIASCYVFDKADNRTNRTIGTSCSASPAGPSFSVDNASATEGGSLLFTVTKSGSAAGTTTVDYATANGTATAGSDYTAKSGTLTFLAADTSKTVSVVTTDDATVESAETVLLNLSNATGGATISDSQGTGTINDNDIAPTCSGVSFTVASNGAVTEGASSVFTITKSGTASGSCSVDYATANTTAIAGSDYTAKSGTLTFTTAQASKTVSVTTTDDGAVESAETFKLNLSNATGGATLGSPSSASATINDNDGSTNQPPVANPDTASGAVCTGGPTINVVANDTDPEGNLPLTVISVTSLDPAMDVSVASSTSVHAHNGSGAPGAMDARYTVKDSLGATSVGTLTVFWSDTGACQ